jgi:hypothetical protein
MYRRTLLLWAPAVPWLASCRSVDTESTNTLNAVVETVDPDSRELLLRGGGGAQSGRLLSMVVSPRVQRLGQIRSGDRVTVRYFQALAAQAVTPFSSTSQPFEGVNVDRRETAGRPGGEVTRVRRGRITVTAVDPGEQLDQLCRAQQRVAHRRRREPRRPGLHPQAARRRSGRPGL